MLKLIRNSIRLYQMSTLNKNSKYMEALQQLMIGQYEQAENNLLAIKQNVQNIEDYEEILESLKQVYQVSNQMNQLISVCEESFFSQLSKSSIYNDDAQEKFQQLMKLYINFNIQRGLGFKQFILDIFEEQIPLAYQKECLVQIATLTMFTKEFNEAKKLFKQSIDMGVKEDLLGVCLNNLVICSEQNLDEELKQIKFQKFCEQNILQCLQAIISFELKMNEENSSSLVALYQLIEQSENSINEKSVNKIIDEIIIKNHNTYTVIMNLIDIFINNQQQDVIVFNYNKKAAAWIKVIFKNKVKSLQDETMSFGRSLLQFAKLNFIQQNYEMAEKVLIDFLESNQPRKSFKQMLGLLQYSDLMKSQNRLYEAEEYEKQAIHISSKLDKYQYLREQIILD